MKTQLLKITSLMAIATVFFACEKDAVKPEVTENQNVTEAQSIVKFKTEIDNTTLTLLDGQMKGLNNGKQGGVKHRFSGLFNGKQKAARMAEDWESCASVTVKENADNTWTLTFDYGDGCIEDGRFAKGIVTFTGYETDSSGAVDVKFENYLEAESSDEAEASELLNGYYKVTYAISLSNDYDFTETFDLAITANYTDGRKEMINAIGEEVGNVDGVTITKSEFDGVTLEGEVFSGLTIEPLFYDFNCSAETYTKGVEEYKVNNKSTTVDYGDGTCDNTVTITTDGVTVVTNLDETEG